VKILIVYGDIYILSKLPSPTKCQRPAKVEVAKSVRLIKTVKITGRKKKRRTKMIAGPRKIRGVKPERRCCMRLPLPVGPDRETAPPFFATLLLDVIVYLPDQDYR
jgi:hypothetical protein